MDLTVALLRHRRVVLGLPFAAFLLTVTAVLLWPRNFTSTSIFYPQQASGISAGLASVASQFGVTVAGQDPTDSPDFYSQLAVTPGILEAVVNKTYDVPGDSRCPCTLSKYWNYVDHPVREATELSVRKLRLRVSAIPGTQTGWVELSVTTKSGVLSRELNAAILTQLDRVNELVRDGQAGAERRFIQGRLALAESSLTSAEVEMRRFLELNRQYQASPTLMFEWQRLDREVTLREGVFASLSQQYENAGIQEVRNTPVIAIPQPSSDPALPDPRWLIVKALASIILGFALGIGYAAARFALFELRGGRRTGPADVALVAADARRDYDAIVAPIGRFARLLRPRSPT